MSNLILLKVWLHLCPFFIEFYELEVPFTFTARSFILFRILSVSRTNQMCVGREVSSKFNLIYKRWSLGYSKCTLWDHLIAYKNPDTKLCIINTTLVSAAPLMQFCSINSVWSSKIKIKTCKNQYLHNFSDSLYYFHHILAISGHN